MNIKALIISLGILGTSSAAMARPVVTYSADASFSVGTRGPVIVRDHRKNTNTIERYAPRPVYNGTWDRGWDRDYYQPRTVVLGDGMNFGDTEYRKDIVPGAGMGQFHSLNLASNGGSTYIMKVVIEFADGGVQQINVNRTLRGYQSLSLDLDGDRRAFHRILIYRADGAEALNMNRRHHGEFTVTAQ